MLDNKRNIILLTFLVLVGLFMFATTALADGITSIVVTVTDEFKAVNTSDPSGVLYIIDPNGQLYPPVLADRANGKYTFNTFVKGNYTLIYNSVFNSQSMKIPSITLPATGLVTVKNVKFVLSTKAGADGGKSGAIGGSVIPAQFGVNLKVSNATSTYTSRTDINGNFKVYLPAGSYKLIVDGNDNTKYKKHGYNIAVTAGQMASPLDPINGVEDISQLGLKLDAPVVDAGSGVLDGIDANTKEIDGIVNSDAMVYIFDTAQTTPILITTAKPNKIGSFVAKFPNALNGKKLQMKVIDSAENVYTLDMASAVS